MTKAAVAIKYDFSEGTFEGTTLVERVGLNLMKLSAKLTSPLTYTGLSHATRILRALLPSDRNIETSLFPDTDFVFPYGDSYWSSLLNNSSGYSPEIESFLLKLRDVEYGFIDCGANYGYMSAIVTSQTFGNKPSIAIEADPETFQILEQNAKINNNRFECLNRAIYSVTGEMVDMSNAKHEARSILRDDGSIIDGNVETVALDDVLDWVEAQGKDKIMLKLDVEGVEIEAMKGAQQLLTKNLVILFEDHASDKVHETSQYFLETLSMRVFYSDGVEFREMTSLDDIKKVKNNPRVGYDFIATKSDEWLDIILNLCRK